MTFCCSPSLCVTLLPQNIINSYRHAGTHLQGTQLFIRSFELGVMFLPSLEARYRQHPNTGFSCTPQTPPAQPSTEDASTCNEAPADAVAGSAAAAAAAAAAAGDGEQMCIVWRVLLARK